MKWSHNDKFTWHYKDESWKVLSEHIKNTKRAHWKYGVRCGQGLFLILATRHIYHLYLKMHHYNTHENIVSNDEVFTGTQC